VRPPTVGDLAKVLRLRRRSPARRKPGKQGITNIYEYFKKIIIRIYGQDRLAALNFAHKDRPVYKSALTACNRLLKEYGIFMKKYKISCFTENEIAELKPHLLRFGVSWVEF